MKNQGLSSLEEFAGWTYWATNKYRVYQKNNGQQFNCFEDLLKINHISYTWLNRRFGTWGVKRLEFNSFNGYASVIIEEKEEGMRGL